MLELLLALHDGAYMIIVPDREALSAYRRRVSAFSNQLDLQYDVLLSVKLQDKETFDRYLSVLPFFQKCSKIYKEY